MPVHDTASGRPDTGDNPPFEHHFAGLLYEAHKLQLETANTEDWLTAGTLEKIKEWIHKARDFASNVSADGVTVGGNVGFPPSIPLSVRFSGKKSS